MSARKRARHRSKSDMRSHLCAIALIVSIAGADANAAFRSGNKILEEAQAFLDARDTNADVKTVQLQRSSRFMAYVMGVLDGSRVLSRCLPEQVTAGQVSEIAANYILAHPEIRHLDAPILIANAMADAFADCKAALSPTTKK